MQVEAEAEPDRSDMDSRRRTAGPGPSERGSTMNRSVDFV